MNKNSESILTQNIVQGMQAKKAEDISIFNLVRIPGAAADYFIICSGQAKRQIEAIAEAIMDTTHRQLGVLPQGREGLGTKEWVLLDYGHIVVHIFQTEKRTFYKLDSLWGDATVTHVAS